jgi:drug/metabolite transporter (DMT)-like permease
MTPFAIFLIAVSAIMHASWNLLTRSQRAEHTFLLRMLTGIGCIGAIQIVITETVFPLLPVGAYICGAISGVFCGLYFLGLARAYGRADFTQVYPMARALPVLLVGLGDVAFARYPSAFGWIGMLAVIAGCVILPMGDKMRFSLKQYLNKSNLWIMLAAIGTTAYSLIDKGATAILPAGPLHAARYGSIFFCSAAITYALTIRLIGNHDCELRKTLKWKRPLIASVLNYGAYLMILWAYQIVHHAGYVVALRQVSILIGAIAGICWFRERGGALRIFAAGLIVLGLVLIAILG